MSFVRTVKVMKKATRGSDGSEVLVDVLLRRPARIHSITTSSLRRAAPRRAVQRFDSVNSVFNCTV